MPSVPGTALSRPNRAVRHSAKMSETAPALDAATESEGAPEPPKFDVKELAGITAPLGFFDPAGFTTDATEGKIRFYREGELECWQPWVASWLRTFTLSSVETSMFHHTSLS